MAISKTLRRALRTGFRSGSAILTGQREGAQAEEERQRQINQDELASMLGLSLEEKRQEEIKKLRRPAKSTARLSVDLAPGFSLTAGNIEDLNAEITELGLDSSQFLGGVLDREEPSKLRRSGRTSEGTISGPADEAAAAIEAAGGIVAGREQRPLKPTNINDIYAGAFDLAIVQAGDEDKWNKLPLTEKRKNIDFFAKQLWEQQNPGIPFQPIEFPPEAAPVEDTRNWFQKLLNIGQAAPAQQEDPEYQSKLLKAQEKKQREPDWDYDGYVRGLNSAYGK